MGKRVAVIMAGGTGERFWPLSRKDHPKQLLKITSPDHSMLGESVEHIRPLVPAEDVFVITGRHLQDPIRSSNDVNIPAENVLGEPCKRNTAGALVYAAASLLARFGRNSDVTMAVLTADHQIGEPDAYRQAVETAMEAAENNDALVTMGVRPTRAETGYGYIEMPEGGAPAETSSRDIPVYPVVQFREKPDADTAQQFVQSGNYLWNSGMFFWRVNTFLKELKQAQPAMYEAALAIADDLAENKIESAEKRFADLEDISIDFALMEKARNVLVVPAEFPWDDVGAWDALDRTLPHDADGNIAIGEPVIMNSTNCIVYNAPGSEHKAVATIGCEDLAVIVADDAVLVVSKDQAQDVKKALGELKERGAKQV